jgi:hypothetical protein
MTWDGNITVNILSGAQAVQRAVFGVPLHYTADCTFAAVLVKQYDTPQAAIDDTELGTTAKAAVAALFAQSPRPPHVLVGKDTLSAVDYDQPDVALGLIIAENPNFYAFDCGSRAEADILAVALAAESLDRLFLGQSSDAAILAGTAGNVAEDLAGFAYTRTALLYHATDTAHAGFAWLAAKLAANPDTTATIWAYETLVGITPDVLSDTEHAECVSQYCNTYETLGGVGATGQGILADGNRIDTLVTKDWFKARVAEGIAQLLLDASARHTKIPYTQAGLWQIAQVLINVANRGRPKEESNAGPGGGIGHFAYRPSGEIIDINVPKMADVDPADIASRTATISGTVTLAGAVENVTINVAVLNS